VASSYTERHVGFALDDGRGEDDEDGGGADEGGDEADGSRRPQRLHRRDTPHHLKNKRINLNKVDEERAADLIAQVRALRSRSRCSYVFAMCRLYRARDKMSKLRHGD
jgi:hypothetical protein